MYRWRLFLLSILYRSIIFSLTRTETTRVIYFLYSMLFVLRFFFVDYIFIRLFLFIFIVQNDLISETVSLLFIAIGYFESSLLEKKNFY